MVAIRSAHINKDEEFNLERWVDSLHQGQKTENKLKKLYGECQEMLVGHERKELLLWRGREMIEILITLSMDRATLQAAMLFPVVSSGLFDAEELKERYGQEIMKLIEGVEEMAAIGQLNSSLDGSGASGQVDNVRRMLLAMVDDFRCVVIKLAERICNLREVKNALSRCVSVLPKSAPISTRHWQTVLVSVSSSGRSKITPSVINIQISTRRSPNSWLSVVSTANNTLKTLWMTSSLRWVSPVSRLR
ncbi:GTP pyrophosphokinase [Vibrio sp. JCM 19236]|nr:GTP pyrophosphokinase [Vibrio sp. JCM 19236]